MFIGQSLASFVFSLKSSSNAFFQRTQGPSDVEASHKLWVGSLTRVGRRRSWGGRAWSLEDIVVQAGSVDRWRRNRSAQIWRGCMGLSADLCGY